MAKDISIITLGCSKNLVDSEVLSGQLAGNGYSVTHETNGELPETVIINTCGFIENAKSKGSLGVTYANSAQGS